MAPFQVDSVDSSKGRSYPILFSAERERLFLLRGSDGSGNLLLFPEVIRFPLLLEGVEAIQEFLDGEDGMPEGYAKFLVTPFKLQVEALVCSV